MVRQETIETVGGIVWAWAITMPAAGLISQGLHVLARFADRMLG